MEVGASSKGTALKRRRTLFVVIALVAIMAMALFLRAYWNVGPATADGFVFSGGSDAYYEKRAIDHILDNDFQSLVHDPLLNYPYGKVNPNPPLYNWLAASTSYLLAPVAFGGDLDAAAWWVTLWAPVAFGVLTVLPMYFLGAALFDRRAGLLAAFFWAISTSAIDNTGFGDSRHYAPFMFFIALSFLFYVKAVKPLKGERHWVERWSSLGSVWAGKKAFMKAHAPEIGYAVLAGISVAATGLVWKGFPYILGIIGIYAVIQMLVDHWRNRDPFPVFALTALTFLVGLLLAAPYYYGPVDLGGFVRPALYMFGGFLAVGLILAPTRDLPTVLVMPLFAVGAILGALVAFVAVPSVGQSLLYSAVYFKRTSIYLTIAEAHPADFNSMVFSVGPWVFFASLVAIPYLLWGMRKRYEPAHLFLVVWAVLALYMAQAAARFLVNAVPVFAVLGAYATVRLVDWLDFRAVSKAVQSTQSLWQGIRRGLTGLHVVGALALALLLVFPGVFYAVDAAMPPERETDVARDAYVSALVAAGRDRGELDKLSFGEIAQEYQSTHGDKPPFTANFMLKRFGAFGQNYLPDDWYEGLTWLDQYDADIPDPADRPGILSWWDYGHWEIYVGRHPAVADNFQNGYVFAANFLLSQNETHALQLMSGRQADLVSEADAKGFLAEAGVAADDVDATYAQWKAFEFAPALDDDKALALLKSVEASTGKKIRYFAVDVRMLPYDNPGTPEIEQTSIFYAPVTLAGKEPDAYVQHMLRVGPAVPDAEGQRAQEFELTSEQYEERLKDPFSAPVEPSGQFYVYQQPFFNTMYWRSFAGGDVAATGQGVRGDSVAQSLSVPTPGAGLEHFRLIYANDGLRILEFTPGATVTGVVEQNGRPLDGVQVTAFDDAGAEILDLLSPGIRSQVQAEDLNVGHSTTTTDENGRFRLTVPFGNVTLLAGLPGAEAGRASVQVSRAEAEAGAEFSLSISVEPASVEGLVFLDANGNGTREEGEDLVTSGTVEIDGVTGPIGGDGTYLLTGVAPGQHAVNVTGTPYEVAAAASQVALPAGETTTHNISLEPRSVPVAGRVFLDKNGNGAFDAAESASFVRLQFQPSAGSDAAQASSTFSDSNGTYEASLKPGTYAVTATTTDDEGTPYALSANLTVAAEAERMEQDFAMTAEAS